MVKIYNSKGLSNNLGTPCSLKITRKGKKFVAVYMVLSSLLLGSLTSYATTEILGVYTPSIVYAETLSELQAKYTELNEQYNSKLAEVQKYDKEMESHSGDLWKGWFSAWGTAKVNKEKAEGELAKILEQKNEVSSKINDIDRGVSAAYSYAGKDAGDKEKAKAEQQKALVQTEQELKEGSAKSQADENSKKSNKGKTESNYKGGTDQNINTKDNDRQYVKDPRRSSTDAIKFISDDEATKSLMESSTKTINSAIGNKNLLVYSKMVCYLSLAVFIVH